MQANDYQLWTKTTAIYPKDSALLYLSLGLASEAGEVAGKFKKMIRDGGYDAVGTLDEIGDVLWYCARLCDEMGFRLEDCMQRNHDKLNSRKERGTLSGSGDTR